MNIDFETMREPGFFHRVKNDKELAEHRIGDKWKKIYSCPVCGTPNVSLRKIFYTSY